jgi:radical SAM-linked protein
MLRVFQRACVRVGIRVCHSEGFNPRPKLSLPLPRPVGVEADDELLCLRILGEANESRIMTELSAQLPEGCELLSVHIPRAGTSFQPCSATYVLPIHREYLDEKMSKLAERLLGSESIPIQRRTDAKGLHIKNVDVRGFLKSIKFDNQGIIVECVIGSAGSIRVDEILGLLDLDEAKLSGPIRRTNVQWQNN